jgi:hypothetical protein
VKKIGRIEKIGFPDLNIISIDAKVDTGAYSIALHVDGIRSRNGKLSFWIDNPLNRIYFDKYETIEVKSSFGKIQKRYSIMTRVKVGRTIYKVYISLTNRKGMKYPVLIGRRFLYKFNYIVDVRKKNINDRAKKM